jgi:hypothetical protein
MDVRGHKIVGFSGHMTDAPDRGTPRFPESRVESVRTRLRAVLERQTQPLHGVSSGARGGDLIFLEELLALGGSATILLPFPAASFKHTSVGRGWNERFDRVLSAARVEVPAPLHAALPASSVEQEAAFESCNALIIQSLTELATLAHDARPLFIAVFHDSSAQHTGGTWDALARWRQLGHPVELIDPMA